MAKMSKKMERTLHEIRYSVNAARTKSFDEWRGPLKDDAEGFLREIYEDQRHGIIRDADYDGRTLAALERRGYIRYYDDISRPHVSWTVMLVEE